MSNANDVRFGRREICAITIRSSSGTCIDSIYESSHRNAEMAENSSTESQDDGSGFNEIVIFFRWGHFDDRVKSKENKFDVEGKERAVIRGLRNRSM